MNELSLQQYLEHIAEFGAKARHFCNGMTQEQLAAATNVEGTAARTPQVVEPGGPPSR